MGLAMNLEEHEVGAVILGDDSNLKEGDLDVYKRQAFHCACVIAGKRLYNADGARR